MNFNRQGACLTVSRRGEEIEPRSHEEHEAISSDQLFFVLFVPWCFNFRFILSTTFSTAHFRGQQTLAILWWITFFALVTESLDFGKSWLYFPRRQP